MPSRSESRGAGRSGVDPSPRETTGVSGDGQPVAVALDHGVVRAAIIPASLREETADGLPDARLPHERPVVEAREVELLRSVKSGEGASALLAEVVAVDDERKARERRHGDPALALSACELGLGPAPDAGREAAVDALRSKTPGAGSNVGSVPCASAGGLASSRITECGCKRSAARSTARPPMLHPSSATGGGSVSARARTALA